MALVKKKEKTYEPIEPLIGVGDDYHIYHMSIQDRIIAGLAGMGIGALVFYLFFRNGIVAALADRKSVV